jgi:hypothetical protein
VKQAWHSNLAGYSNTDEYTYIPFDEVGRGDGDGTTRPYDGIVVTPDSVSNGVEYYTESLKTVAGTSVETINMNFKVDGGIWYQKTLIGTSWQPVLPELLLYTSPTYSVKETQAYIASMGHTIKSWQDQGNPDFFIVTLQEGTAKTLDGEVPLVAIIRTYLLAVESFAGVLTLASN